MKLLLAAAAIVALVMSAAPGHAQTELRAQVHASGWPVIQHNARVVVVP